MGHWQRARARLGAREEAGACRRRSAVAPCLTPTTTTLIIIMIIIMMILLQGLANILASLEEGVAVVDASVAGLGGCPYARVRGRARVQVASRCKCCCEALIRLSDLLVGAAASPASSPSSS